MHSLRSNTADNKKPWWKRYTNVFRSIFRRLCCGKKYMSQDKYGELITEVTFEHPVEVESVVFPIIMQDRTSDIETACGLPWIEQMAVDRPTAVEVHSDCTHKYQLVRLKVQRLMALLRVFETELGDSVIRFAGIAKDRNRRYAHQRNEGIGKRDSKKDFRRVESDGDQTTSMGGLTDRVSCQGDARE